MATVAASPIRLTTEGGDLCPVCEDREAAPEIDLGDYRLFRCGACGCWSSDADVRGASVSFDPADYFENPDIDRDRWKDLLGRREAAGPLGSLLDVGCGNGAFLGFVRDAHPGIRRAGIELDPGRAAEARARDPEAEVLEGDALASLAALPGSFDLVTLWDVFEHVRAPARLLDALAARTAPGGWIYVQTMHEESLLPWLGRASHRLSGGRVGYLARRTHEPHHLVFFTRRALAAMAERSGLAIRRRWWGRLARGRMDGSPWVTAATSALLWAENRLGNGLFVNVILERVDRG